MYYQSMDHEKRVHVCVDRISMPADLFMVPLELLFPH